MNNANRSLRRATSRLGLIGSLFTFICLLHVSAGGQEVSLVLDNSEAVTQFLLESGAYRMRPKFLEDVQFLNSATSEELKQRSREHEKDVDSILVQVRERALSPFEALKILADERVLQRTGFRLVVAPPRQILKGLPTRNRFNEWKGATGGVVYPPGYEGSIAILPGFVTIRPPKVQNGFAVTSPENEEVVFQLLRVMAEEFYHVAQYLRGGGQIGVPISSYFQTRDPGAKLEADVYAKLLETLGPQNIPAEYEESYEERKTVQRGEITLSGRSCISIF